MMREGAGDLLILALLCAGFLAGGLYLDYCLNHGLR